MDPVKWIDLVLSLSTGTCFILLGKTYLKSRSLLELYFALSAFIIFIPYASHLFDAPYATELFEWAKLLGITTYISGLLVLIRESKPVFARFPQHLTALPFISLFFFPFIIDSIVIKDLLNLIYQGGALIVTGLVFTLNHVRKKGRRYYLIGIGSVIAAYFSYWMYFNRHNSEFIWVSEILFAVGILVTTVKFIRQQEVQKLSTVQ